MSSKKPNLDGSSPASAGEVLLSTKEAARLLGMSKSWLDKRRLNGDGPPYVKLGHSVRYSPAVLQQWMKGQQRLSTSGP
jgi:predicted DNA-binding transcriptional regulator AlpA